MKTLIRVLGLVVLVAVASSMLPLCQPAVPEPTEPVRTVSPAPPLASTPGGEGTVAVAGLETPAERVAGVIPRVAVERAGDVTAAVHVAPGKEDVVLLADRPRRRFLPELLLRRDAPGVRLLRGDPGRVTVTVQRLPIVAPEIEIYAGAAFYPPALPDAGAYGFSAAATVVRVWFVHLGGQVTYHPGADQAPTAAPLAAVDVFDGWHVGVDLSGRASVLRRF